MQQNNQQNTGIITARVLHVAMIVAVIFFCLIIYTFLPSRDISIFASDDSFLQNIEIALGILAIIMIAIGYFLPSWSLKSSPAAKTGPLSIHLVRLSFFEAVGVLGLVLGIMGAEWYITLPFIIVSAASLVFSFPTKEKWQKMSLAEQMGNIGSEVSRFLHFGNNKDKENEEKSFERALELLDLTIADARWRFRIREILILRVIIADIFVRGNNFDISSEALNNYFLPFALKARTKC